MSGISHGTELSLYRGTSAFADRVFDRDLRAFVRPDPPRPVYPATLGYELVGTVEDAGSQVHEFAARRPRPHRRAAPRGSRARPRRRRRLDLPAGEAAARPAGALAVRQRRRGRARRGARRAHQARRPRRGDRARRDRPAARADGAARGRAAASASWTPWPRAASSRWRSAPTRRSSRGGGRRGDQARRRRRRRERRDLGRDRRPARRGRGRRASAGPSSPSASIRAARPSCGSARSGTTTGSRWSRAWAPGAARTARTRRGTARACCARWWICWPRARCASTRCPSVTSPSSRPSRRTAGSMNNPNEAVKVAFDYPGGERS